MLWVGQEHEALRPVLVLLPIEVDLMDCLTATEVLRAGQSAGCRSGDRIASRTALYDLG